MPSLAVANTGDLEIQSNENNASLQASEIEASGDLEAQNSTTELVVSEDGEPTSDEAEKGEITIAFRGTAGGVVTKSIAPDESGNYVITSADVPAVPTTRSFNVKNDLGIDFSTEGTFKGWRFTNSYSDMDISNIPPVGEFAYYHDAWLLSDGAAAYLGYYPAARELQTFESSVDVASLYPPELKAGDILVFNPIYELPQGSMAHITFQGISYENGEQRSDYLEYITPMNYVLSNDQINIIIEKVKTLFGSDKISGYSGIYKDTLGNTPASLNDAITYAPAQVVVPVATRFALFFLDNYEAPSENAQEIEGYPGATVIVPDHFINQNPNSKVEVKAEKKDLASQDCQDFKNAIHVDDIDAIFNISLFLDDVEKTEGFGTLRITIPVDSQYNGHVLRVHHYHENGEINTYDCIARNGHITFDVSTFSLFGIQDLGEATTYADPVTSDEESNKDDELSSGNESDDNEDTKQENGSDDPNDDEDANSPSEKDSETEPVPSPDNLTLPLTGDSVLLVGCAVVALVAAGFSCFAGTQLKKPERGKHTR